MSSAIDPGPGDNESDEEKTAFELYLEDRRSNGYAQSTMYSHKSRLSMFNGWWDERFDSLMELRPQDVLAYKQWRKADGNLSPASLKTQMDTLRVYLDWCQRYGFAPENIHEAVESPSLNDGENVRDKDYSQEACLDILERLQKYCYASREHVVFALVWHTSLRRGAVHALDIEHFDKEDQRLKIRHNPETNTPLKKKSDGERTLNLSVDITELLSDWVNDKRPDVVDNCGRNPLISTPQGRAHKTTIADDIYYVSAPSFRGLDCSCEECEMTNRHNAYCCDDSVSPHVIRAASITYHLDNGWPIQLVADRANNSEDVIREHYDQADEEEQADRRRKFMDALREDDESNS